MALDIIFLLDGSTRSVAYFNKQKEHFPHAKKFVTPLAGIQAYKAASKLSNTSNFYLVDHNFVVHDEDFKFEYIPDQFDKNYVHAWRYYDNSDNQRITVDPWHGGVFLFSKAMLRSDAETLDKLGDGVKYHDEVVSHVAPLDVIIASVNGAGISNTSESIERFAEYKVVYGATHSEAFAKANEVAETENYYVVDARFVPSIFPFTFRPHDYDAKYVHVWTCLDENFERKHGGIVLLNRSEFTDQDYEYSYGPSVKFIDDAASYYAPESDSIIFLSYDEPNAETNWQKLKSRFPQTKRVHGVNGILNAHKKAAELASTSNFFVVDADSEILDSFDFNMELLAYDKLHYVHIWKCRNPANGLEYGYGGVKMFHKSMFEDFDETVVDMSTLLGDGVKLMDQVASITHFNSDDFHAFRGAFRECTKLSSGVIKNQDNVETLERLNTWTAVASGPYADFVLGGAVLGKEYGTEYANDIGKLQAINKFDKLYQIFREFKMDKKKKDLLAERFKKIDVSLLFNITNVLYRRELNLTLSEIRDALSSNELLSKFWLIDEINNLNLDRDMRALIVNDGLGLLGNFLFQFSKDNVERVLRTDFRVKTESIADAINIDQVINKWQFKAVTCDAMALNYERAEGVVKSDSGVQKHGIDWNILLSPHCEMLQDVKKWSDMLPTNRLIAAQTVFTGDAVELNKAIEKFKKDLNLKTILFEGVLPCEVYDRLMVIGIK